MLKTAEDVIARARELARKKMPVVAVAGAEDDDVLRAVGNAHKDGLISAVLVGNTAHVQHLLEELQFDAKAFRILDSSGVGETVQKAVELCSRGECQILMKGKVPTPDLMKAVLSPKAGLRQGQLLSHCAVLELAGYPKLLSWTDGGVTPAPDFSQRMAIVENAVRVHRFVGVAEPKVALLSCLDESDPEFPTTMEAAALARACKVRGIAKHIEGPMTLRTALSARINLKWHSEVAGEPDILVTHAIEEVNIAVKSLGHLRNAVFMGVIAGARVPFSLVSRSDPPKNKLASLALAAVMAGEAQ
jgi:phosphate butyryltransferase